MNKKWKLIAAGIVGVVIIAIVILSLMKGFEADLITMEPRDIAQTFREDGKVIAQNERQIHHIYGGKITELPVVEGQMVNEGDILLILDTTELEYQIEQLQGQILSLKGEREKAYSGSLESEIRLQMLIVEQAEKDLESAVSFYERIEMLYKEGAVSKMELDEARNNLSLAKINLEHQRVLLSQLQETYTPGGAYDLIFKGRIEAIEAQINLLKYKIQNGKIKSPIHGIVSNINVKEGGILSPGIPAMTIFQPGAYEIETLVLTREVGNLSVGMEVKLTLDKRSGKVSFPGEVKSIASYAVDRISPLGLEEHRVPVKIIPYKPEGLEIFPGYRLEVEFTTYKEVDRMVVPKTTLFSFEGNDAVWVVRDGRAQIQPVKKGFETDREVVILEGLEEGDLVVLNPHLEGIGEGKRITGR